ncbi:hypothetical protein ATK30_6850 [Amycolatopsis echigonensis]|uniref:Minor structural protein GP20 n=1 Tax=Amycolatopsis echigonensis TaxID=2576905 RepID=A0A2N3WPW6_9PSEU|nr:hypothetical protein [Amycolatopsis niigatensis]PKV95917.1 hypothetical protein ATK30_6850 [Amycolatopsis niigatensis]
MSDNENQNPGDGTGTEPPAGGDSWTPPTREEWDKHQADLRKANAEAANRKRQLAEQAKQNETDAEKTSREAAEAARSGFLPFLVKAEAKAAFLAEGADAGKVAKLTRLLDMAKIEMDGDELTGLDEQVAELKADFPELFKTKPDGDTPPAPPRVPRVNTAPARPGNGPALSPGENIARALGIGR